MSKSSPSSYITSERFIHDELLAECRGLIDTSRDIYRERRGDPSIVVSWPAESVTAEGGEQIEGFILAALPKTDMKTKLRQIAQTTKAYGLLVIEQRPDALVATFESPHGARCWKMQIKRHGDVDVLSEPVVTDNEDHLGIVWSPLSGTA